jgi:hypothetical protein
MPTIQNTATISNYQVAVTSRSPVTLIKGPYRTGPEPHLAKRLTNGSSDWAMTRTGEPRGIVSNLPHITHRLQSSFHVYYHGRIQQYPNVINYKTPLGFSHATITVTTMAIVGIMVAIMCPLESPRPLLSLQLCMRRDWRMTL